MARTTSSAVQAVLGGNYDDTTDLAGFIATAGVLVDRVATCATARGVTLTTTELEVLERWLAAHFYGHADQFYKSKTTERASATFQGNTGMGLESTQYGQAALSLDPSGCLAAIGKQRRAAAFWLGKTPTEQIDYRNRL